jgi:HEAT repeat protein
MKNSTYCTICVIIIAWIGVFSTAEIVHPVGSWEFLSSPPLSSVAPKMMTQEIESQGDGDPPDIAQMPLDPRSIEKGRSVRAIGAQQRPADFDAVLALTNIGGPSSVPALAGFLNNSSSEIVRFLAATALGEIRDPGAVLPLISALKDPDRTGGVQVAAARALAKLQDLRAVDPLIECLKDGIPDVRAAGAGALGILKNQRAVHPLIEALGDENHFVRINTARALGEMKAREAVEALIECFMKDGVSDARWWAGHALGEIGDPRAVEALAAIVKLKNSQGVPFSDALQINEKSRIMRHPLADLIKDAQWNLQLEAIRSLGRIGEAALPHLNCTLFGDPDFEFRKEAAKMIIGIRGVSYAVHLLGREEQLIMIKSLYDYVISKGESGSEVILVDVLNTYGETKMARDFIGSENPKLARAAEAWMEKNGYGSLLEKPEGGPRWGDTGIQPLQAE